MIKTFADRLTAALFDDRPVRSVAAPLRRKARRKLLQLDAVSTAEELRIPSGNRLEKLVGDRDGQWSIRVDGRWRICFRFREWYRSGRRILRLSQELTQMMIDRKDLPNLNLEGLVDPGTDRDTPIPPGEILQEDFLKPLGLSATGLARALRVPANRITAVLKAQRGITADTAMRLARYFGTTPEFWMHLQSDYELRIVRRDLAEAIAREVTPRAA